MDKKDRRLGVGVIVVQDGKILLGKRKGSHGAGTWAPPGGHMEIDETPEECAKRELLEETGLQAISIRPLTWVNRDVEEKNYLTFFVIAEVNSQNACNLEPHKCEEWNWFNVQELPQPLIPTMQALLEKVTLESFQPAFADSKLEIFLQTLVSFYKERDWEQFHSPKNVVMDVAAEVGELVELFRWLTEAQSYNLDAKTLVSVQDEIADVFKSTIYLAHKLGINPIDAAHNKLKKMGQKYPAELAKGKCEKYTAYHAT